MNMNYRLTTIRQEQANLFNELRDAETWAKDNEQEPWLEEQISWNVKDMGQDLLRLWDWIVELDLRHNELACVVADYDWEGQQKIIEELLANYIQSVDAYLRIRKSPLPPFGKGGKGGIFEVDDDNTVKKLEVLRRKAEWCLHPDDSFMDTPEVQEAIARAEADYAAGRFDVWEEDEE
jgi:hypothetical protein